MIGELRETDLVHPQRFLESVNFGWAPKRTQFFLNQRSSVEAFLLKSLDHWSSG